jgi:hypothetical protein
MELLGLLTNQPPEWHVRERSPTRLEPGRAFSLSWLWIGGELFTLEQIAGYLHIRIGTAEPCGLGPVSTRLCHAASPFQTDCLS